MPYSLLNPCNPEVEDPDCDDHIKPALKDLFIDINCYELCLRIFPPCQFYEILVHVDSAIGNRDAIIPEEPVEVSLAAPEIKDSLARKISRYRKEGFVTLQLPFRCPPYCLGGITEVPQVTVKESEEFLFAQWIHRYSSIVAQMDKLGSSMVQFKKCCKKGMTPMEEFRYKEYTEEESRIYHEAMQKIMEGLTKRLPFDEACSVVKIDDEQLSEFIKDDALKMVIADMHYNKGISLEQVAEDLKVQVDILSRANAEMLQDIEITSMEIYRAHNPGTPAGSA